MKIDNFDFAKLIEVVPQTYGEAIQLYPNIKCESHEWDNRTTIENTVWLIHHLTTTQLRPRNRGGLALTLDFRGGVNMFSLEEWFEIVEGGTSGDQVTDILYDWQKDRDNLLEQIKNLTTNAADS